jgi:cation diffusion facilitator family transporter
VGVGLVYNAVKSMRQGHDMAPGWAAFAAACVSVATKEGLFRWTLGVGHRTRSSAVTANAWHHRSDALSSIPVAVAVLAVLIDPGLSFLDHVAAVLVSALIIHAAWRIARPALSQLADRGATVEKVDAIRRLASSIAGVREVHALRTRYVGPDLQADLHVLVDPELTVREGHDIATAVKLRLLAEGPDVVDVLVHVEPFEPGLSRRGQDPHGATG